ncbi:MAG: hypothetical protein IPO52_00900 [Gemmatimonadetes bacterium]|nr:hypothetical protein [Gemmatimonadota bacterium]
MPVLDSIIASTRATLPALQARQAELEHAAAFAPPPPSFVHSLRRPTVALIAEVKRRSPSAGAINAALDPATLAQAYAAAGGGHLGPDRRAVLWRAAGRPRRRSPGRSWSRRSGRTSSSIAANCSKPGPPGRLLCS